MGKPKTKRITTRAKQACSFHLWAHARSCPRTVGHNRNRPTATHRYTHTRMATAFINTRCKHMGNTIATTEINHRMQARRVRRRRESFGAGPAPPVEGARDIVHPIHFPWPAHGRQKAHGDGQPNAKWEERAHGTGRTQGGGLHGVSWHTRATAFLLSQLPCHHCTDKNQHPIHFTRQAHRWRQFSGGVQQTLARETTWKAATTQGEALKCTRGRLTIPTATMVPSKQQEELCLQYIHQAGSWEGGTPHGSTRQRGQH